VTVSRITVPAALRTCVLNATRAVLFTYFFWTLPPLHNLFANRANIGSVNSSLNAPVSYCALSPASRYGSSSSLPPAPSPPTGGDTILHMNNPDRMPRPSFATPARMDTARGGTARAMVNAAPRAICISTRYLFSKFAARGAQRTLICAGSATVGSEHRDVIGYGF